MPLTVKECSSAEPRLKPYRVADSEGLYLEVSPTGRKYWRFKYRFMKKEKRLAFGVFPSTTLAEAREKRYQAKKLLTDGIDPSEHKKEQQREALLNAAITFELIGREWYDNQKSGWSDRHAQNIRNRLERDVYSVIGSRPIRDITAPEVLSMIRKIEKRGALDIARRATQMCGQIFRYAIVTGRASVDPSDALKGALKPSQKGHFASIEIDELPEFIKTLNLNHARLYQPTVNAVKLLMLTFVRTNELVGSTWDEINLEKGEWNIPAERMKMRRPHIVPLAKQAISILKNQKERYPYSDFVFPNQVHHNKHMSNCTVLGAIKRLGYKGRMTGHGFRALAMSGIKEKLDYRHEVIDRQLAHAPRNRIDAAYDRAMFLDDRKIMMQDWADYLDKIVEKNFTPHM